jgi:hypothetical protein
LFSHFGTDAYNQAQIVELLGKLEDEYNAREQLWVDFEKAMNELGILLRFCFDIGFCTLLNAAQYAYS